MLDSITCQIQKLDRDIDLCKERLQALKKSQPKKTSGTSKCKNTKGKSRKNKSVMNRRVPAERDLSCKKHCKAEKPNECLKKTRETANNCSKKEPVKARSRSASCGRECRDCVSENNYHHNDLKQEERVRKKNSWANILKDHNKIEEKPSYHSSKKEYLSNRVVCPTSIYLKNRGVQCSDVSFVPSKSAVSGNTHFTAYEPSRTLQFLLSEVRENLKHKREDKVLSIINDMEDTIYRIKSNHEYQPLFETKYNCNTNYKPSLNNVASSLEMNKIFEEGFSKLETTCKTLEVTCARLKEENKQLSLELQKKEANISFIEKREKENNIKIDMLNKHIIMMSSKGSEYSQSIQDLSKLLAKLQQENKCIEPLRDLNVRMETKLTELTKEKNISLYENKLLQLENEKLKVLLEMKEKQLSTYKETFCGLEDKINKEVNVMQGRCVSEESDADSSAPLCSSPNTSASIMAPAYGSWQVVSCISSKADLNQDSSPPLSLETPLPIKKDKKHSKNEVYTYKISEKRHDEPVSMKPNFDVPLNKVPRDDIDTIKNEIKKLFSNPCSQPNDPSNQKTDFEWVNLNSVHASNMSTMSTCNTTS